MAPGCPHGQVGNPSVLAPPLASPSLHLPGWCCFAFWRCSPGLPWGTDSTVRQKTVSARSPLTIPTPAHPHQHQTAAWERTAARLHSRGHPPVAAPVGCPGLYRCPPCAAWDALQCAYSLCIFSLSHTRRDSAASVDHGSSLCSLSTTNERGGTTQLRTWWA